MVTKSVDVTQAVGDIVPVRPHAGEPKVADRSWLDLFFLRHIDINNRPFLDLHGLKGLEDAILIFRRDSHGVMAPISYLHRSIAPETCAAFTPAVSARER